MLKRPCHFYNSVGKCRFGKHCKFLHETVIQPEQREEHNQDEAVKNPPDCAVVEVEVSSVLFQNPDTPEENGSLNQENQDPQPAVLNICKFYAKNRFCRYGKRCRYQHVRVAKQPPQDQNLCNELNKSKEQHDEQNQMQDEGQEFAKPEDDFLSTEQQEPESKNSNKKKRVKICHFFKQGGCQFGKRCRYFHPRDVIDLENDLKEIKIKSEETKKKEINISNKSRPPATAPKVIHVYKRSEILTEKVAELKETEIRQLKRRFPRLVIVEETYKTSTFVFTFSPADPDWPYDVRLFDIEVTFGEDYPLKLFTVALPVEQDLPETVRRYIEVSLQEWVAKTEEDCLAKGTVELLFRPFLRWMDKNMESIVTEGLKQLRRELTAKAAGMQFILAKELRKNQDSQSSGNTDQEQVSDDQFMQTPEDTDDVSQAEVYRKSDNTADEVYLGPNKRSSQSTDDDDEEEEEEDEDEEDKTEHKRPQVSMDTERRGTEMAFRNMQMWFITTVMVEKLRLVVQCSRCKNQTDFTTPPNRVNSVACSKCNSTQLVVFRPTLAHGYSSTFGYLDLDGCQAFDLILQDCHFSVGCIVCSRDVLVKSIVPGKQLEMWCRECHNKMKFGTETFKFIKLTQSEVDPSHFSGSIHQVNVKKMGRVMKDPAIQEGKPLPDNGSCKHYKKSFRWLRFPCCGKCYPCDQCHDDREDHEMKYANRMICGYCCREQPYAAEKPCVGCSSALTKARSTHWEGGRGCRNKITMSRGDDKKYNNLNKTTSSKAQALADKNKGKKNTKLRHT